VTNRELDDKTVQVDWCASQFVIQILLSFSSSFSLFAQTDTTFSGKKHFNKESLPDQKPRAYEICNGVKNRREKEA